LNHIGCVINYYIIYCVVYSGEAPSVGLHPIESTETSEDGPLDDAVQDMDEEDMPAKGAEVLNIFGALVG